MSIFEAMQAEIREVNTANGRHEDVRPFGDDIALLHSEVSEMYEAYTLEFLRYQEVPGQIAQKIIAQSQSEAEAA